MRRFKDLSKAFLMGGLLGAGGLLSSYGAYLHAWSLFIPGILIFIVGLVVCWKWSDVAA